MIESADENPYVTVAAKKYRALKKKLEKIVKLESQARDGRIPLNKEQEALLPHRANVERSLADVEAIKLQLELVAREQLDMKKASSTVVEHAESGMQCESNEVLNKGTMTLVEDPSPSAPTDAAPETEDSRILASIVPTEVQLARLLKVLHVCARYEHVTQKRLPPNVDYFGKSLLGLTSISSFSDALATSARSAVIYIDRERAEQNEVLSGMSYEKLSQLVDFLSAEIEACVQFGGAHGAVPVTRSVTPPPPAEVPLSSPPVVVFGDAPAPPPPPPPSAVVVDDSLLHHRPDRAAHVESAVAAVGSGDRVELERTPGEKPRSTGAGERRRSRATEGSSKPVAVKEHAEKPRRARAERAAGAKEGENGPRAEAEPRSADGRSDKMRSRPVRPSATGAREHHKEISTSASSDAPVVAATEETHLASAVVVEVDAAAKPSAEPHAARKSVGKKATPASRSMDSTAACSVEQTRELHGMKPLSFAAAASAAPVRTEGRPESAKNDARRDVPAGGGESKPARRERRPRPGKTDVVAAPVSSDPSVAVSAAPSSPAPPSSFAAVLAGSQTTAVPVPENSGSADATTAEPSDKKPPRRRSTKSPIEPTTSSHSHASTQPRVPSHLQPRKPRENGGGETGEKSTQSPPRESESGNRTVGPRRSVSGESPSHTTHTVDPLRSRPGPRPPRTNGDPGNRAANHRGSEGGRGGAGRGANSSSRRSVGSDAVKTA